MTDASYRRRLVEHLPRIRALVGAIAKDQGRHDDIVQECLTHLIAKEHLWDARKGRIEGWFNTLSRRVTYRFLRRQRARARKESAMAEVDLAAPVPVVDADQIRWVLEQYSRLPVELREVLHLRYHEALTVADVGRRLGISQQAASKRLAKALAHLQRRARSSGVMSLLLPWQWPVLQQSGVPVKVAVTLLAATTVATPFFLPSPDTALVAGTSDLPRTTIVASPSSPLATGENAIWCSSVQMCWNEIKSTVGGAVTFQGEQPPADAARLNSSTLTASHVDDRALVAGAGSLSSGVVERLQQELQGKFGRGRDPVLDAARDQVADMTDPWIGYAFLYKDLPFEHRFEFVPPHPFTGPSASEGQPDTAPLVSMFGIPDYDSDFASHRKLAAQVRVAYYESETEHVARLLPANGRDEILLCRIPPGATLEATWKDAQRRIAAYDESPLEDHDRLLVPTFDFDLRHSYDEFVGRKLANPGWEGQVCRLFVQDIRFRLDERGAELRSRTTFAGAERKEPHWLDYDGPFLVVLKERAKSEPYFLMWVANAEVLVKPTAEPEAETPSPGPDSDE